MGDGVFSEYSAVTCVVASLLSSVCVSALLLSPAAIRVVSVFHCSDDLRCFVLAVLFFPSALQARRWTKRSCRGRSLTMSRYGARLPKQVLQDRYRTKSRERITQLLLQ